MCAVAKCCYSISLFYIGIYITVLITDGSQIRPLATISIPIKLAPYQVGKRWSTNFDCAINVYFIWLVDGNMSHIGICSDMLVVSWCLRLSHFSQLSFMQFMGLCVFSFPIYLTMIVRIRVIYLIFTIKSEVWPICHCLGLGHETLVCAVCLSIFFELFFIFSSLSFHVILTHAVNTSTGKALCSFLEAWFRKLA